MCIRDSICGGIVPLPISTPIKVPMICEITAPGPSSGDKNGNEHIKHNGYLYNLLVWSGTEFDIRDYKNYWVKKDEQSNWMDRSWYLSTSI